MKVKRSKFINDVRHHIADVKEAEAIADLAEEAGVEWLPEEPELPGEIKICTSSSNEGRFVDLVWANSTFDDFEQHLAVYLEAVARWNFVTRLDLSDLDQLHYATATLRRILDEERAKLRTP